MVNIYEYKKRYDKVAFLPDPDTHNKIYFRSPTVFEFLRYSEQDTMDIKVDCVSTCVFAITDAEDKELDIKDAINDIVLKRPGFVETLYRKIVGLSPLVNVEECKSIYLDKKQKLYRVLNLVKMQFLTVFGDSRLAEECENFSFAKFMEYVVMLEEVTGKKGLTISELTGDDSLMDTETKIALEKMKKEAGRKGSKPDSNFPKTLGNVDTGNVSDPALKNAINTAQLALQNKMAEDKVLAERGQLGKSYDWQAENADYKKEGI